MSSDVTPGSSKSTGDKGDYETNCAIFVISFVGKHFTFGSLG